MSDGITFDDSGPEIGSVFDGSNEFDIDYQALGSELCGSWQNVSDDESNVLQHEIAVGICDDSNIHQFENVGLNKRYCFKNLTLVANTAYCLTLRTTNGAGIPSVKSSDGVLICGPPLTERALVVSAKFFSGVGSLQVSWTGFRLNGAPIVDFSISIYTQN